MVSLVGVRHPFGPGRHKIKQNNNEVQTTIADLSSAWTLSTTTGLTNLGSQSDTEGASTIQTWPNDIVSHPVANETDEYRQMKL